jgi:NAD(P)-dependent dehydrogenase (short-subunit alcohol dehydrogenase family)
MSPAAIISDTTLAADTPESENTAAAAVPTGGLFSLKDRTVVITGAGRGLGVALTIAVLESGGDAVCLDVLPCPSVAEWDIVSKSQKTYRTNASYHQCDITQEAKVIEVLSEAAKQAASRGKPIRSLISCAGIQQMTDAIDYPVDGFRRILDVNVLGSFVVAKQVARIVRNQQLTGSIVLIASMSGQIANRVSLSSTSYLSSRMPLA